MSKKPFDLEDPDTWPDTIDELGALENESAQEAKAAAPENTPTPEQKEPEAAEKKETATEEPVAAPVGVATHDGAEVLPYEVLKAARDEIAALKAQLAAMNKGDSKESVKQPEPEKAPSAPELPPEIAAKVAAVRTAWGDDIAEQTINQYYLQQQIAQQNAQIAALQQTIESQRAKEQRREDDEVSDAIAASPKMAEWAAAEDKTLFEQSIALHKTLMGADKTYAAMDWRKRMQVLPTKVIAVFASTPEEPKKVPVAGLKQQAAVASTPEIKGPVSLTDFGGAAPTTPKSTLDEIKDLEGAKLIAYMDKQARNPAELDRLLRTLM